MEEVFLKLLQMSTVASWLIVAVIVLRLLLKKAPKNYFCILWGIVALRLVCPFSIESVWGVVPNWQILEWKWTEYGETNENFGNQEYLNGTIGSEENDQWNHFWGLEHLNDNVVQDSDYQSSTIKDCILPIVGVILSKLSSLSVVSANWLIGIVLLSVYSIMSWLKLRKKVKVSLRIRKNIYLCDNIRSPFILGVFHPKVYIPSDLTPEQIHCVIAHEQTHIKRLDHWWKPIGFILLIIYWFHPFVWISYLFFCRDMELACDESVIQKMNHNEKALYVQTLVLCSVVQHKKLAYTLAFGETGIKERVKFMVHYKKPTKKNLIVASIMCAILVVCFGTSSSAHTNGSIKDTIEEVDACEHNFGMEHLDYIERDAYCIRCGTSIGEIEYVKNEDDTYSVVGIGTYLGDNLVIPVFHNGKSVVSIEESAFEGIDSVTIITIPATVKYVGKNAFGNIESGQILVCVNDESKPEKWEDEWYGENVFIVWLRAEHNQ